MKQVIVIRKDLNMRKGKMCAQAAHASMKVLFDISSRMNAEGKYESFSVACKNRTEYYDDYMLIPIKDIADWVYGTFTKAVVSVDSEYELLGIYDNAKEAGLLCSLIQDIGATEFHGVPTYTAVAVGPGKREDIDKITGHLKLL